MMSNTIENGKTGKTEKTVSYHKEPNRKRMSVITVFTVSPFSAGQNMEARPKVSIYYRKNDFLE
jgi:hypothetical protein